MTNCVFCQIISKHLKSEIIYEWDDVISIVPINPVCTGHILFIPKIHVSNFSENPEVTALTYKRCAEFYATNNIDANLITSKGKNATQTIFHLHIHLVPRLQNDGLHLPWSK